MSAADGIAKVLAGLCVHGHELSAENILVRASGVRVCRQCELFATRGTPKTGRPVSGVRHGEVSGYTKGCRCEVCVAANTAYHRSYNRRPRAKRKSHEPKHSAKPAFCVGVEEFLRESERRRAIEARNRLGAR